MKGLERLKDLKIIYHIERTHHHQLLLNMLEKGTINTAIMATPKIAGQIINLSVRPKINGEYPKYDVPFVRKSKSELFVDLNGFLEDWTVSIPWTP